MATNPHIDPSNSKNSPLKVKMLGDPGKTASFVLNENWKITEVTSGYPGQIPESDNENSKKGDMVKSVTEVTDLGHIDEYPVDYDYDRTYTWTLNPNQNTPGSIIGDVEFTKSGLTNISSNGVNAANNTQIRLSTYFNNTLEYNARTDNRDTRIIAPLSFKGYVQPSKTEKGGEFEFALTLPKGIKQTAANFDNPSFNYSISSNVDWIKICQSGTIRPAIPSDPEMYGAWHFLIKNSELGATYLEVDANAASSVQGAYGGELYATSDYTNIAPNNVISPINGSTVNFTAGNGAGIQDFEYTAPDNTHAQTESRTGTISLTLSSYNSSNQLPTTPKTFTIQQDGGNQTAPNPVLTYNAIITCQQKTPATDGAGHSILYPVITVANLTSSNGKFAYTFPKQTSWEPGSVVGEIAIDAPQISMTRVGGQRTIKVNANGDLNFNDCENSPSFTYTFTANTQVQNGLDNIKKDGTNNVVKINCPESTNVSPIVNLPYCYIYPNVTTGDTDGTPVIQYINSITLSQANQSDSFKISIPANTKSGSTGSISGTITAKMTNALGTEVSSSTISNPPMGTTTIRDITFSMDNSAWTPKTSPSTRNREITVIVGNIKTAYADGVTGLSTLLLPTTKSYPSINGSNSNTSVKNTLDLDPEYAIYKFAQAGQSGGANQYDTALINVSWGNNQVKSVELDYDETSTSSSASFTITHEHQQATASSINLSFGTPTVNANDSVSATLTYFTKTNDILDKTVTYSFTTTTSGVTISPTSKRVTFKGDQWDHNINLEQTTKLTADFPTTLVGNAGTATVTVPASQRNSYFTKMKDISISNGFDNSKMKWSDWEKGTDDYTYTTLEVENKKWEDVAFASGYESDGSISGSNKSKMITFKGTSSINGTLTNSDSFDIPALDETYKSFTYSYSGNIQLGNTSAQANTLLFTLPANAEASGTDTVVSGSVDNFKVTLGETSGIAGDVNYLTLTLKQVGSSDEAKEDSKSIKYKIIRKEITGGSRGNETITFEMVPGNTGDYAPTIDYNKTLTKGNGSGYSAINSFETQVTLTQEGVWQWVYDKLNKITVATPPTGNIVTAFDADSSTGIYSKEYKINDGLATALLTSSNLPSVPTTSDSGFTPRTDTIVCKSHTLTPVQYTVSGYKYPSGTLGTIYYGYSTDGGTNITQGASATLSIHTAIGDPTETVSSTVNWYFKISIGNQTSNWQECGSTILRMYKIQYYNQ